MEEGGWEVLARRRVRHYGHNFVYEVQPFLARASAVPETMRL